MQNKFDIYEPPIGHLDRFSYRLDQSSRRNNFNFFKYAVAAAIIIMVGIGFALQSKPSYELSSVSPELKQTQDFFEGIIYQEINQIKKFQDSENKVVIDDTMMKISELEQEYKNLKEEYRKNGYNKFIINAMIYNFQQRIEVLQLLQQTIEHKNNFKKSNHETNII